MLILLWIYLPPWILSSRNSVRVVLLIAQGWRGTSLPRVNVRKEIQRHRCWAFSVRACLQWNLLWQINQRNSNTDGIVSHKPYINPGLPALSFGNPGLSKAQHLRRWNVYSIKWLIFTHKLINGRLRRKSATPTALIPLFYNTIDADTFVNKLWITLKRYNTYSVVPHTSYANPG